jgi:hypothetical protein
MQSVIKMPNALVLQERLAKAGFRPGKKMSSVVAILADQNKDPQDIARLVSNVLEEEFGNIVEQNIAEEKLMNVLFADNLDALKAFTEQRNREAYDFMKGSM